MRFENKTTARVFSRNNFLVSKDLSLQSLLFEIRIKAYLEYFWNILATSCLQGGANKAYFLRIIYIHKARTRNSTTTLWGGIFSPIVFYFNMVKFSSEGVEGSVKVFHIDFNSFKNLFRRNITRIRNCSLNYKYIKVSNLLFRKKNRTISFDFKYQLYSGCNRVRLASYTV